MSLNCLVILTLMGGYVMLPISIFGEAASTALLTPEVAGSIFKSMWDVVAANFAGVAVLLGSVAGLMVAAKLINGARKGRVRV